MEIKNRIVMATMGNDLQGSIIEATEKIVRCLEEGARKGTGLITTHFASVSLHTTNLGAFRTI